MIGACIIIVDTPSKKIQETYKNIINIINYKIMEILLAILVMIIAHIPCVLFGTCKPTNGKTHPQDVDPNKEL